MNVSYSMDDVVVAVLNMDRALSVDAFPLAMPISLQPLDCNIFFRLSWLVRSIVVRIFTFIAFKLHVNYVKGVILVLVVGICLILHN